MEPCAGHLATGIVLAALLATAWAQQAVDPPEWQTLQDLVDASNETALYAAALGAALALAAATPAAQQLAAALNSTAAPATAFLPLDASVTAAEAQELLDLLDSDPEAALEGLSYHIVPGVALPPANLTDSLLLQTLVPGPGGQLSVARNATWLGLATATGQQLALLPGAGTQAGGTRAYKVAGLMRPKGASASAAKARRQQLAAQAAAVQATCPTHAYYGEDFYVGANVLQVTVTNTVGACCAACEAAAACSSWSWCAASEEGLLPGMHVTYGCWVPVGPYANSTAPPGTCVLSNKWVSSAPDTSAVMLTWDWMAGGIKWSSGMRLPPATPAADVQRWPDAGGEFDSSEVIGSPSGAFWCREVSGGSLRLAPAASNSTAGRSVAVSQQVAYTGILLAEPAGSPDQLWAVLYDAQDGSWWRYPNADLRGCSTPSPGCGASGGRAEEGAACLDDADCCAGMRCKPRLTAPWAPGTPALLKASTNASEAAFPVGSPGADGLAALPNECTPLGGTVLWMSWSSNTTADVAAGGTVACPELLDGVWKVPAGAQLWGASPAQPIPSTKDVPLADWAAQWCRDRAGAGPALVRGLLAGGESAARAFNASLFRCPDGQLLRQRLADHINPPALSEPAVDQVLRVVDAYTKAADSLGVPTCVSLSLRDTRGGTPLSLVQRHTPWVEPTDGSGSGNATEAAVVEEGGGGGASTGAIVGGVVGGLAALAAVATGFLLWRRRRCRRLAQQQRPDVEGKGGPRVLDELLDKPQVSLDLSKAGLCSLGTPTPPGTSQPTGSLVSVPSGSRHSGGDRLSDDRLLTYLASRYSVRLSTVGAAGTAGAASAAASGGAAAARRSAGSSSGGGGGGSAGGSDSGEPWPGSVCRGGSGVDTNPWEIDFAELEIIQAIGEGSFGKVYLARWLGIVVACKVLIPSSCVTSEENAEAALAASRALLAQLDEEAGIMASMRHPHVVSFLAVSHNPPCMITEYCARGGLDEVLAEARRSPAAAAELTWTRRLMLALDAACGMLYLHERAVPVIHRDLKSPNLLIDDSWRCKVADFNLSRFLEDARRSTSAAAMNPRWLAPEVMRGQHASKASDVYSFGIVLWELLTWRLPWAASDLGPWQLVALVLRGGRPEVPARDQLPGADTAAFEGLEGYLSLMERCWAQDPAARPGFDQVVAELKALLGPLLGASVASAGSRGLAHLLSGHVRASGGSSEGRPGSPAMPSS